MINFIMHGCNGAMGRVISAMAQEMDGIRIAAGVDLNTEKNYDYPVYASLGECTEAADAVVDFASAKAVDFWITVWKKSFLWCCVPQDLQKNS
mgnify:CR=1 FL=1